MTTTAPSPNPAGQTAAVAEPPVKKSWWRRPWVGPLMLTAMAFVAVSLPRYLTFDPALSRLEPPPGNDIYYPILVAHVVFGSVAILTSCLQVWQSFRQRYPKAHRISGRIYVLGGALPGGVTALYIGVFTPFGPAVLVANLVLGVLWLTFTVKGFLAARRRQFADHRKWMIRSFAMTWTIVVSRIVSIIAIVVLFPQADTTFGGSEEALLFTAGALSLWTSIFMTLLTAQWWLDRKTPAQRRAQSARQRVASGG